MTVFPVPCLRFNEEAQVIFDGWYGNLEGKLRSGSLHLVLESHLAKFRSLIPTIALISHLADGGTGPVDIPSIRRACGWAEYLESHAERVYSTGAAPENEAARAVERHIMNGDLPTPFSLRDVYTKGWAGLGNKTEAKAAVVGHGEGTPEE